MPVNGEKNYFLSHGLLAQTVTSGIKPLSSCFHFCHSRECGGYPMGHPITEFINLNFTSNSTDTYLSKNK